MSVFVLVSSGVFRGHCRPLGYFSAPESRKEEFNYCLDLTVLSRQRWSLVVCLQVAQRRWRISFILCMGKRLSASPSCPHFAWRSMWRTKPVDKISHSWFSVASVQQTVLALLNQHGALALRLGVDEGFENWVKGSLHWWDRLVFLGHNVQSRSIVYSVTLN